MSITVKTVKPIAFRSAFILIYRSHNPTNGCIKSSPTLCFFLFNKPFHLEIVGCNFRFMDTNLDTCPNKSFISTKVCWTLMLWSL